jgi:hypothetical protein
MKSFLDFRLWHGLPARENTARMAVPPLISKSPWGTPYVENRQSEIVNKKAFLFARFSGKILNSCKVMYR